MTPAHGIWKKDFIEFTHGMVFNSSETNNKLAGKILGDLIEKNCTTVFDKITEKYTGKYFFRLETSKGIKHSFPESVEINVKASPPKPQLNMQTRVMEGEWVNGTCVVEAPCPQQPPTLTWGPLEGSAVELRRNTDGTHTAFSYLRFQASHRQHHGWSVSCSAAYSQGGSISSASTTADPLAVLYPPRNLFVSVTPSGLVAEGTEVTLACLSDAYPPVEDQGYRWFRDKDPVLVSSPILVLNWSSNDTGLYYCEAENPFGAQISSAVKINVSSTDNVKSMSNSMSLGLSCFGVLSIVGLVLLVSLLWRRLRPVPNLIE